MNLTKCKAIFERFKVLNPHPTTELNYSNPFELLIAVMLSAHATDSSVNKSTRILYSIANTPEEMLALGEEKIKNCIKNIGLYNNKAKNIMKTCEILINQHHSQLPGNREDLENLPGVGRKTANIILNTFFDEATIGVDTHIFRVANRTGLAHGKTPREVERQLTSLIPLSYKHNAHHWLVLHGRYICTARKPKCPICPINDLCEYPDKTGNV